MRAAEYVRVSTDHQQYSIINQQAAIAEYAARHNFEIVKTYADPAKSGLDIKHRPGLQSLIDDVVGGRADFRAVLVFDVSRWGRFQDSDEAACYEFLCKRAGIRVHYCAEPFPNDDSMTTAFLKMVKRTMAAEYLRELSAKVHVGQCRLVANGFKHGGAAGFGLRRLLLDSEGKPKMVLRDGERKSLTTERVTYTLGPEKEVQLVREIFSMFLDQNIGVRTIVRALRRRGLKHGRIGHWDRNAISKMLTNPKYAGSTVFNRISRTLGSKVVRNPPEQWVLRPNTHPAIVSQDVFDRTQTKLQNAVERRSNDRVLAELRTYFETHDKPLPKVGKVGDMACAATYAYRFGSMTAAYELIQHQPVGHSKAALESRRRFAALKLETMTNLREAFTNARVRFVETKHAFRLYRRGHFQVELGRCFCISNKQLRWRVITRKNRSTHTLIVVRLGPENDSVRDFVLLPGEPKVVRDFRLNEDWARTEGTIHQSIDEVVTAIIAKAARDRRF